MQYAIICSTRRQVGFEKERDSEEPEVLGWCRGASRNRSEATARQHRAGREERCDDRKAPAGNEVEADNVPGGTGAQHRGGRQGDHKKADACSAGLFVVPAGHDPATP